MMKFVRVIVAPKLAYLLLTAVFLNLLSSVNALALTSGPNQPEFSNFESVSTSEMVNKFTGDFTYNIPIIEVPGPQGSTYPLSLSYHSGANVEEEASWVGYGWTLNPGAINRSTRGFPDDFSGSNVTYWNKTPKNWTVTTGVGGATELFGSDKFSGNAEVALRYNSSMGFGTNVGLGVSLGKGLISLGYQETDGRHSFSGRVNPMAILSLFSTEDKKANDDTPTPKHKINFDVSAKSISNRILQSAGNVSLFGGGRGLLDYGQMSYATKAANYTGASYNISVGLEGNPSFLPAGVTLNGKSSYTKQENRATTDLQAYGFMYSAGAVKEKSTSDNKNTISDYYNEKEGSYEPRDVFLSIPFNNADVFNVSGEGMGGAFRLHHDKVGEFGPDYKESKIDIQNYAAEVSLGVNFGVGLDGGLGTQTLRESSWAEIDGGKISRNFSSPSSPEPGGEGTYFRFMNDMATDWNVDQSYAAPVSDAPLAAKLTKTSGWLLYKYNAEPSEALASAMGQTTPKTVRPARGSYIGYHSLAQMATPAQRYCKRADVWDNSYAKNLSQSGGPKSSGLIGEMSITSEAGQRFTYGLPLFSRNESNLQYGAQGVGAVDIRKNYLIYTDKKNTQVGQISNQPYATTYLLTEVCSPDYIDRTLNGPSADDFGGYTLFKYVKPHSFTTGQGFHWRFPYTGHIYDRNSLSDPLDDVGSVSEGDKEIAYLKVIRTKTHTAIFTTGQREDGIEAGRTSATRTSAEISTAELQNRARLQRLEKIDLYANSDIDPVTFMPKSSSVKPIKTVKFRYSYRVFPDTPNSVADNKGRLTLEQVWFEFNQIDSNPNAKVSLYNFGYNYPDASSYPASYATAMLNAGVTPVASQLQQTPDYSPFGADGWGNWQEDNVNNRSRFQELKTGVNQIPESNFDPAAWQLKVIKLPSKGEIHIQYEQDDYAYVQDKPAHVMVSLAQGNTGAGRTFVIDPASVGVTEAADVRAMALQIKNYYVAEGSNYEAKDRKIFFKFLYSLIGSAPRIDACNTDYVSGYADVKEVKTVPDNPQSANAKIQITLSDASYGMPQQVCQDFYATQRRGKLSASGNCDPATNGIQDDDTDPKRLVQQFLGWAANPPSNVNVCLLINPELSYFKVPFSHSKKGGGIRVKRLLTYAYDPALESAANKVVYGSEFFYTQQNSTISSGVATNEPASMRQENALVEFMPRLKQHWASKIISGVDRKQAEGPLGETVLPAPSVGYSYVVERSIYHDGVFSKTTPGFSVTEYCTAKNYPVKFDNTTLEKHDHYVPIVTGFWNDITNESWATQGFSVVLNNMHGQLRQVATYAGNYLPASTASSFSNSLAQATLVTKQVYEYFQPQDKLTIWNEPGQGKLTPPLLALPGREEDITVAQHAVSDETLDASIEFDASVGFAGIFPAIFASVWPGVSKNKALFCTYTASKVVRYPAIVKSIQITKDGITHVEENLAFDQHTGRPVAVRSQDEFSDNATGANPFAAAYLKEDVMASWVYPEKRSRAKNEGIILSGNPVAEPASSGTTALPIYHLVVPRTNLVSAPASCDLLHYVGKGDLVMLNDDPAQVYSTGAPDYAFERVALYPILTSALPATINKLTVLQSGNTNELGVGVGSTTYHKDNLSDVSSLQLRDNMSKYASLGPATSQFQADFDAAIQGATFNGAGSSVFTVNRPGGSGTPAGYGNLDISGFYPQIQALSQLPAAVRHNPSGLRINNLSFKAQRTDRAMKIVLVSFDLLYNGTPYPVSN
jgi:hypothetical protein